MSISASQLIAAVSVTGAKEAAGQLLSVGSASEDAGTKLKNLTIAGVAIAGAALIALGAASLKSAADFQTAMLSNVAHAGLAKSQVDRVSQSVLAMSTDLGRAPTELAEALYPILSAFSGIQDQSAKSSIALQTLKDSFETVAGTTVDGTAVANAAVGTFNALGLATNNAATNASRMNDLFDVMDKTVQLGNMQWDAYKNVVSKLAVAIQGTGISFNESQAALAELTNEGFSAQKASTYLANTFTTLELKTDSIAKHAKSLGIAFDEQKFKSMDLAHQIEYLNQATDGNKTKILALLNNNATALKTFDALSTGIGGYKSNLDALNHAQGTLASSFDTASQGFNFQMERMKAAGQAILITIGTQLLPVATRLAAAITPIVVGFNGWITSGHAVADVTSYLSQHAQVMVPLLSGAAVVIGGVLVAAFSALAVAVWAALAPILAFLAPFLLVGAAVAGLVAIFMHFYQTSAPFKAFIDQLVGGLKQAWSVIVANFIPAMQAVGAAIQTYVLPLLSQVGAFLVSNFMPVWKQLVDLWNKELVPLGKQLWAALQPLMPLFIGLAELVGGVIVVAFGLLIGLLAGLIKGLAGFLSGLVIVIQGVVQMFTGVGQVIGGIIRVIIDLVTLNFSDLGPALGEIWQGIINIFVGAWTTIAGIFLTAWFTISGIVVGFVQGIIGFFTTLYNDLVGHSIIPDMVNGIINWFMSLVARGIALITHLVTMILVAMVRLEVEVLSTISLMVSIFLSWLDHMTGGAVSRAQAVVSGIAGVLGRLPGMALQWGSDLIHSLISGIQSGIGALSGVVGNVVNTISGMLHHSKPDFGPLANDDQWMPDMMNMFASGIESGVPRIRAALSKVTNPLAVTLNPSAGSFVASGMQFPAMAAASSGSGQVVIHNHLYVDGKELSGVLVEPLMDLAARKTRIRHGRKTF